MKRLYINGNLMGSRRQALRAVNYARAACNARYIRDETNGIRFTVDAWLQMLEEAATRGEKLAGWYTMRTGYVWPEENCEDD